MGEEVGEGQGSGIDFCKDCLLGLVFAVDDACFGLQHAPGFAAFDAEHDQLAAEGVVGGFAFVLDGDGYAEVGDEGAVARCV